LPFSQPAPDHSTFSRFRGRLPKAAIDAINSERPLHNPLPISTNNYLSKV
jgi:hypothetical protein